MEAMRRDQQFDQPRVGFGHGTRIGAVDQHPYVLPGTAKPYWHAQGLGFGVRRARQWRRSAIEEDAKPRRVGMYVDLLGSDVDALDQDGKEGALPCSWRLGPSCQ